MNENYSNSAEHEELIRQTSCLKPFLHSNDLLVLVLDVVEEFLVAWYANKQVLILNSTHCM